MSRIHLSRRQLCDAPQVRVLSKPKGPLVPPQHRFHHHQSQSLQSGKLIHRSPLSRQRMKVISSDRMREHRLIVASECFSFFNQIEAMVVVNSSPSATSRYSRLRPTPVTKSLTRAMKCPGEGFCCSGFVPATSEVNDLHSVFPQVKPGLVPLGHAEPKVQAEHP